MGNCRQPFRRQENLRRVRCAGEDRLLVDALLLDGLEAGKQRIFEDVLGIEIGRIGRNDDDVGVPDRQLLEIDRTPPLAGIVGREIACRAQAVSWELLATTLKLSLI